MAKVCMVRCGSYDRNLVQKAIDTAFSEMHASDMFKPGEKILLKPNLLSAKNPDKAVTTHPEVFRSVAAALGQYQVKLSYGDSPATDTPDRVQKICGIEAVADELSIPKADFVNSYSCDFQEGALCRKFQFVKAVEDNDAIVSISKLKTHALTRITGAMKNQFGLIPGMLKSKDHFRFPDEKSFSKMITDLNNCVKPRLYVMDAVVGMEGNGPANGTPRQIGMILVSDDPVAMDSVCAGLIGLDYKKVMTVMTGEENGLGIADYRNIDFCLIDDADKEETIIWDRADKMVPRLVIHGFRHAVNRNPDISKLHKLAGPLLKRLVLNRPVIVTKKCTKCNECIKICPVEPKAIYFSEEEQKIKYDYSKCIRCFCCQETCPSAAIIVAKAPLDFLIKK
ncbi:MAG: DUF362 domain-containing protein [Saccharofermentanales bacterium]